ncbi:MAG: type II toxin-antitoxin system RelE/ParE family toxin [Clostridia bacterium]|nr:type II toxin-antitoxin system RelE/ParE family toxin [Clostridia bacterium]
MDELTIFWTQTAKRQSEHIFVYWNNRNKSKSYSKKLNFAIKERIELLKSHPEMGKKIILETQKKFLCGITATCTKLTNPKFLLLDFGITDKTPKSFLIF